MLLSSSTENTLKMKYATICLRKYMYELFNNEFGNSMQSISLIDSFKLILEMDATNCGNFVHVSQSDEIGSSSIKG